jgi:hypothetical protein
MGEMIKGKSLYGTEIWGGLGRLGTDWDKEVDGPEKRGQWAHGNGEKMEEVNGRGGEKQ